MVVKNERQLLKLFNKATTALRFLVFIGMAISLTIVQAAAQSRASGEVRGTVLDSTGAAIPGVKITVRNQLTGVVTNLTSDNTGVYDAASVDPGTYTVTFEKEGFKKFIKTDIVLHVEAITVNATLEVGAVTQQIEVKGGAPLVQTETSDRGEGLSTFEVSELPSATRSWFDYSFLLPGANGAVGTPQTGGSGINETNFNTNFNGSGVGFNGQGGYQMLGLMDGGTATMIPGQNYTVVPMQTISEIQMETSNFSAEYSNGLAVFNVILKSGTNQFHGEGFEFVQNNIFDARNFFTPSVPPLRWNMYGGTIGGPIKKNKLFFFFGFQNSPDITYSTGITTYPTAAMRGGDLSGLPTVYDPNTLVQNPDGTYSRTAFTNNQIPSNRIDTAAKAIMSYYPMPNLPGDVNNYYYAGPNPVTTQTYDWKVDYNISSGNRLTASQNYFNLYGPVAGQFWPTCYEKIDCVNEGVHMQTDVISDVWSITPNAVNEYRQSLMRSYQPYLAEDLGKNWGSILGIAQLTAPTFPGISIGGTAAPNSIGMSFKHAILGYTTVTEADTFTLIKGKHILKFGGEYNNSRTNGAWADINAGDFSFSGQFTEDPQNPSATGLGFADFLLGVPASWSDGWSPGTGARTGNAQAFAQDDFKVTPKLTVNLGLRWLQQRGYTEQFNRLGSFDPTIVNPDTGTLGAMWYGGQRIGERAHGNNAMQATQWTNFEPRIGFAWAPKDRWSIRGSYGIYDNMWGGDTFGYGIGTGTSVAGYTYAQQPLVPYFQLDSGQPPPAIPVFPPSADFYNGSGVIYGPYHIPMPYVQQWHFSVQHQFTGNTMLEVAYVGSHAVKLSDPSDLDQVPESGIQQIIAAGGVSVNVQPYRPYPQYTGIFYYAFGGWSNYNALQITFKKNLSHGLWLQSNYTWSHALDTNTQNGWNGAESDYQIALDPRSLYGNSLIDQRHTWNGEFIYELPFGEGKAFLNKAGVLNGFVGGWRLSNIWTAFSGPPFNVTWGGGGSDFSGSGTWYPNRVCNGAISNPSVQEWFNPSCFPSAALGTYGNAGRNILYGPPFFTLNTSLAKNFKLRRLGEAGSLQLRMDVSDVTNHPDFTWPNGSVTPPPTAAGTITTALQERILQLGVRVIY
jgi:hypothetical protein